MSDLFEPYLDKRVFEKIWNDRYSLLPNGKMRSESITATVLFTDLVGYSKISEKLDEIEVMDWLNEYMSAMSKCVLKRGGMINKYIGDAIMSVFGAPLRMSDDAAHARLAVDCALLMRRRLMKLAPEWENRAIWKERGIGKVGMRIGIVTGRLTAGCLGSGSRIEYTVIGDIVNTASRLESVEKSLMPPDIAAGNCRILIGQSTQSLLGSEYRTREVPGLHLSGMDKHIGIFGVIGKDKPADSVPIVPLRIQPAEELPQRQFAAKEIEDDDLIPDLGS